MAASACLSLQNAFKSVKEDHYKRCCYLFYGITSTAAARWYVASFEMFLVKFAISSRH